MKFLYINAVGVEFEGNWNGERYVPPFEDIDIKHDGSVNHINGFQHYGEIAGPALKSWDELEAWMRVHHPHGADKSCGFHIHTSLKRLVDYSRLMAKPFHKLVLDGMEEWAKNVPLPADHPFWPRWKGENQYCKKAFIPTKQLNEGESSRYTQLNYCWTKHGTLEFRMLPMFTDVEHTVGATAVYLQGIEDFLLAHSKSKKKRTAFSVNFSLKGKDLIEKEEK